MRSIVARQLLVASRTPALAAACCVHAAVIGTFALVWRHGMPALPGANIYEQQQLVQFSLLSVLLPWAAARTLPAHPAHDLSATAAAAAIAPSRAAAAGALATFAVLVVIALTGVAPVVLAQQVSGVPFTHPLAGVLPVTALAAVATVSSYLIALEGARPLPTWTAATLITASFAWMTARLPGAGIAIALTAIVLALAAMKRFDSTLLYPHEVRP